MKLGDYLNKCDKFLESHWPKILKEYEAEHPNGLDNLPEKVKERELKENNLSKKDNNQVKLDVNNVMLEETDYVDQVIYEATIVHMDKSKINLNRMRNYYPFQVNDDENEESVVVTDESDLLDLNISDESDDEVEGTTDSSFKAACYNVKLVAINESSFSLEAFQELQQKDPFCSEKLDQLKKKQVKAVDAGYFLKRKILMRKMETADGQINNVLCVPLVLVKSLLESTHRSLLSGHFGSQRYYLNMSRKYYWPKMKDQIMEFHGNCLPCLYNDKFPVRYASGHVIRPLWPMHVVHCDLMVGLPRALDGSTAILLLYDGFSRFTYGIALTSEKADYCVKKLMSHYVAAFGLPWALHSDNGRNVDGALIRHLALMLGVVKTSTPPHTPNANPTETMCGAVAQLLRKGLNESDKRYWSLCLPFVLNALNSTVHTATGYSPNSLFFGRYQERDLVPLIPFDCESANVNEYFQKMRRFQELSFQIVRSRNERRLQAKKDSWDETARNQPYNVGDYVLVKNNNPASGPGKMKLRAKYVGPFRVIKVYLSSLIVVPWTQNARLEEYYRDPNVFRLMHRGDIKPFHTRQVSVKHCKPFKGDIKAEEIIDPIMLSRFLDDLGVNNDNEILSEIDPESTISSTDSGSTGPPADSDHSRGPTPPPPGGGGDGGHLPRYDDPDPEVKDSPVGSENNRSGDAPGYNSDTERFISNLEISDDDKDLLRYYCQIKDEIKDYRSFQSQRAFNDEECSEALDNLKELLRSADPAVREKAENELQLIIEDMKYVHQHETIDKFKEDYYKIAFKSDSGKKEGQSKAVSEISSLKSEPVLGDSNPASVQGDNISLSNSDHADMPELEGDDNLSHVSDLTWDREPDFDHQNPDFDDGPPVAPVAPIINIINSPNVNVNTGSPVAARLPPSTPVRPTRASSVKTRTKALKRLKTPEDQVRQGNVADWLIGRSPRHGQSPPEDPEPVAGDPGVAPKVTRSGRLSKPITRFDPALESRMQKDMRTAIKRSLPTVKASGSKVGTTGPTEGAAASTSKATTAKKTAVAESEKTKNTTAKTKTVGVKSTAASKAPVTSRKTEDNVSGKSKVTEKTPGANRLSDDEPDNLFW